METPAVLLWGKKGQMVDPASLQLPLQCAPITPVIFTLELEQLSAQPQVGFSTCRKMNQISK